MSPRTRQFVAPHNGQRDMVGLIIVLPLHSRKRHAVVGGDYYKSIVEFTHRIEHGDDTAEMLVEMFDFKCIVKHIGAHGFVIRPIRWHRIDVCCQFALSHRRSIFVSPVWLSGTIPEAERPRFIAVSKEIGKIGGIVHRRYSRRRRLKLTFIVFLSCQQSLRTIRIFSDTGSPSLAGVSGHISGILKNLGERCEFIRITAPVISGFFKLPGVTPCEHAGSGGRRLGIACKSIIKKYSVRGNAVEGRGFYPLVTISTHMTGIVGHTKQYIGSGRNLTQCRKHTHRCRQHTWDCAIVHRY